MPENLIPHAWKPDEPRDSRGSPNPFARRAATPAERKAFDEMQTDLIASYMVLGSVASSEAIAYHVVDNDDFPFAATDGVAVYLNRNSNPAPGSRFPRGGVFSLPRAERVFVLAHEVVHILREDVLNMHVFKTQGFMRIPPMPSNTPTSYTEVEKKRVLESAIRLLRGKYPDGRLPFDSNLLNKALDCIINNGLVADKVGKMPMGRNPEHESNPTAPPQVPLGCLHHAIDWNTDTREAYAILLAEQESQDGKSSENGENGENGDDGGAGSKPALSPSKAPGLGCDVLEPGSAGDPRKGKDDPGADTPIPASVAADNLRASQPERQTALERAVNTARQAGQESSHVERMVRMAREPGIDWRQYFHGWVARAVGTSAYDWTRPLRRDMLRDAYGIGDSFFSPARGGHGCMRLVVAVDTSSSIGEDEIRVALSVITEAMEDLNPKEGITVIFCDTLIQRVQEVEPGEDVSAINVPKGGGTSFIPPFEYVRDRLANECDGLVYLTDLHGPAPSEPPPYPVLWVSVTDRKGPWGETVNVSVENLVRV